MKLSDNKNKKNLISKIEANSDKKVLGNSENKLRVAAYVRVSTDTEEQKDSLDNQRKYFEKKIANNENWELVKIYIDEGLSGTKVKIRPKFKEIITDACNNKIDLIITKSISRFARNTLDTLKYVRMLSEKNVNIIFEEENINTLTMGNEFLLTILSAVAQQEVVNLSEHVKKALNVKMQHGEFCGTLKCYGYDYVKDDKQIYINNEQALVVKRIFELYLEGNGTFKISQILNNNGVLSPRGSKWNESVITKILKNEKYTGDLVLGKSYTVDPLIGQRVFNKGERDMYLIREHHDAIIDKETFDKVQQEMKLRESQRNHKVNSTVNRYSFSGKMKCGFCGNSSIRNSGNNSAKYYCSAYLKKVDDICNNCKPFGEDMLKKAFMQAANRLRNHIKLEYKFSDKENLKISYARKLLLKRDIDIEKFDSNLCDDLINFIIVGEFDEKGKKQPYTLRFIIKSEYSPFSQNNLGKIDMSKIKTKDIIDFYCNYLWHDFCDNKVSYHSKFRVIVSYELDGEE